MTEGGASSSSSTTRSSNSTIKLTPDSRTTAPELYIDEKYDRLIDRSLRRVVYGVGIGGLSALLLFRGPFSRTAAVAFGAGVGLGSAWQQSSAEFESLVPDLMKGRR